MKIFLLISLLFSIISIGCKTNPDEIKIKSISKEMETVISKKEQIAKEIKSKSLILSQESLENFPDNRSQLEPIADEQIRLFNEMIKLDESEIEKLKQAESLNLESDFLEFVRLMRMTQEKTIELSKLRIQKFQLISDKTISTRKQLEERIAANNDKQSNIESEISQLEEQREKIKINR